MKNKINLTIKDIPQEQLNKLSTEFCCLHKHKRQPCIKQDYFDSQNYYFSQLNKYMLKISDEAKIVIYDLTYERCVSEMLKDSKLIQSS